MKINKSIIFLIILGVLLIVMVISFVYSYLTINNFSVKKIEEPSLNNTNEIVTCYKPTKLTEFVCSLRGGVIDAGPVSVDFSGFSNDHRLFCISKEPYSDAGKSCQDDSDCLGKCINASFGDIYDERNKKCQYNETLGSAKDTIPGSLCE